MPHYVPIWLCLIRLGVRHVYAGIDKMEYRLAEAGWSICYHTQVSWSSGVFRWGKRIMTNQCQSSRNRDLLCHWNWGWLEWYIYSECVRDRESQQFRWLIRWSKIKECYWRSRLTVCIRSKWRRWTRSNWSVAISMENPQSARKTILTRRWRLEWIAEVTYNKDRSSIISKHGCELRQSV